MTELEDKSNEQDKGQKQLSNIDLLHHLIKKGSLVYLKKDAQNEHLIETLLDWMQQELKLKTTYTFEDNLHTVSYEKTGGITGTLGLGTSYKLFFLFDDDKLLYDIKAENWFENPESKFSLSTLVTDSFQAEIENFILEKLLEEFKFSGNKLKINNGNHFVEKLSAPKKIWFINHSNEDELMLVFLQFSSLKKNSGDLENDKELTWFLLISSQKSQLLAFNKREELVQSIDCSNREIKVIKEIGRDPVEIMESVFLTTRTNDELFYLIQSINELNTAEEKLREIARINWIYKKKNQASNEYAIDIYQKLIETEHNPFDELSLLFMEFSTGDREKVFSEFTKDNKLINLLHHILNYAGTNELLTKWIQGWEVSYIDSVAINNLLVEAVNDAVQANNILPFHRLVRDEFLKKDSDIINTILFDITFCRHLIKCGFGAEAKKILKKRLKQLPDESISDLLPAKDIDLTGLAAGQVIKVTILEILSELETEKNAIEYKCQIARLQPLVEERVDKLIEVSEESVAAKGGELKSVMTQGGFSCEYSRSHVSKYKVLEPKILEDYISHPASRKGGSFSGFQKWLASVKIPDYSMLKSYSEKLVPHKHQLLNEVLTDIKYALNIENIEVYISRGEKSVGISSFESEPSFLIVGGEHLDENSPHFLRPLELKFAVGVELAHLKFKHARITANDMWKGAVEKGYFMLDTVLSIIPAVGLLSKSIQGIGKLNSISLFLQKASKIGAVSGQSREILSTSEQIIDIYKSKVAKGKKADETEKEFLATSRIIQLTADRCALIFTKDLKAAIRSMFLVSRKYYSEISLVDKYGLKEFLLKKDENGDFCHQELALRLASLFSFYLSDDYENAISNLEK